MSRSLYGQLLRRFRPQQFRDGVSRRDALKAALAAGAGLLLSSRFGTPLLRADTPASTIGEPSGAARPAGKRVAVVGAGFGGLACAYELKSAGYHVTVLEARNRVGGRVLSLSDVMKDKNVEGGAEFIGSNHPCWVNYAKQFGLEFLDVSEDENLSSPLVLDGKRIDDKQAKELLEEMDKIFNLMNEDAGKVNPDEPWLSEKAAEWDKKTTADWLAGVEASALAKQAAKAELEGNNTVALALQSYLGNLTQVAGGGIEKYWTDTEVFRCKGGNQQLAMKLAKAIGLDSVNLNVAIRRIVVKENGVTLTADDNRVIEADDVVLAVPPSTWGKVSIEPGLPEALKPQMGKGTKYLAAVKKNFWKDSKLAADGHSDGDVSLTWDGTDAQPDEENGAVMVVFSGGPAAEKTLAYPKDPARRDAKFAEEVAKLYPDFAQNFLSAKFMDWPNDPLTLASYSFPAPGQITTQGKILREGIGRLHFAGEAASYKFVGYMEGGLNSGASLARRLARRDGLLKADAPDPTKLPPPPPDKEKPEDKSAGLPKAAPGAKKPDETKTEEKKTEEKKTEEK